MLRYRFCIVVVAFAFFIRSGFGDPFSYTTLSNGASDGLEPFGINDAGSIVGLDSFLYQSGNFSTISDPSTPPNFYATIGTFPYTINDHDEIAGYYVTETPQPGLVAGHGFVESGGKFESIDVYNGASYTHVFGINDSGAVVGWYVNSSGQNIGFVDMAGSITSVIAPGSSNTLPSGINDSGQIVGDYTDSSGSKSFAFIDTNGTFCPSLFPVHFRRSASE